MLIKKWIIISFLSDAHPPQHIERNRGGLVSYFDIQFKVLQFFIEFRFKEFKEQRDAIESVLHFLTSPDHLQNFINGPNWVEIDFIFEKQFIDFLFSVACFHSFATEHETRNKWRFGSIELEPSWLKLIITSEYSMEPFERFIGSHISSDCLDCLWEMFFYSQIDCCVNIEERVKIPKLEEIVTHF